MDQFAAKEYKEAFQILDCDQNENWNITNMVDASPEDKRVSNISSIDQSVN